MTEAEWEAKDIEMQSEKARAENTPVRCSRCENVLQFWYLARGMCPRCADAYIADLERALSAESDAARMLQERIERLVPNAKLGKAVWEMPLGGMLSYMPDGWYFRCLDNPSRRRLRMDSPGEALDIGEEANK